jgi:hypothetical protein
MLQSHERAAQLMEQQRLGDESEGIEEFDESSDSGLNDLCTCGHYIEDHVEYKDACCYCLCLSFEKEKR